MFKTVILVLGTAAATPILGQEMLAGVPMPEDDLQLIDTLLLAPTEAGTNSLVIDANSDGTPDLLVSVLNADGGLWFHYYRTTITPLSGCDLLGSTVDTCFGNSEALGWVFGRSAELGTGDMIPGPYPWSDTTLSLARSGWVSNYPDGLGMSCDRPGSLEQDTGYVAFRIIAAADTLLGWMRISNVTSTSIFVHELAVRAISTGIVEAYAVGRTLLYPNPTNGMLHFRGSPRTAAPLRIAVFDASARRVMEFSNSVADPVLDMSGLPSGPYSLRCSSDATARTYHFVILK